MAELLMDARGVPTAECPQCGSNFFRVTATFDPDTYEMSMYLLDDAACAVCFALVTPPTPLDLGGVA